MLILLSPAKSLDFESPVEIAQATQPDFLDQSEMLIERLRQLSPVALSSLMQISAPLAELNHARYREWQRPYPRGRARQAVLAFNGDVYEGLDVRSLSASELDFCQRHLRILSGLYGVLRPLDLILPYRLEMGIRLDTPRGKDLYAFWGERVTDAVNAAAEACQATALVNLASIEYFKAIKPKKLRLPVVQPVFEDWSGGRFKVVSFHAKKARGSMARHAARLGIVDARDLQGFSADGYAYSPEASDAVRWVFRRRRE